MISTWISPGGQPNLTKGQLFRCAMREQDEITSDACVMAVEYIHRHVMEIMECLQSLKYGVWTPAIAEDAAWALEWWPVVIQSYTYDALYISWFSRSSPF